METESDDIDMNGENEEKASNLSQEENSSEQVKIICFVPFHSLTNPFTSWARVRRRSTWSNSSWVRAISSRSFWLQSKRKSPPKHDQNPWKRRILFSLFVDCSRRRNSIEEKEDDLEMLKEQMQPVNNIYIHIQPSCIKGTMRSYQIEALNWLVNQFLNGLNCILADEMGIHSNFHPHSLGLGKTLEAISLLGFLKQYYNYSYFMFPPNEQYIRGPHLILVPKSTLGNWMNEIRTWCPSLRPIKLHGDKEERQAFIKDNINVYRMFWGFGWVLALPWSMGCPRHNLRNVYHREACSQQTRVQVGPFSSVVMSRYIIIDEAHRIKNENSKLSMMLREVQSNNRLLLTGTPLQVSLPRQQSSQYRKIYMNYGPY